MADASGSGGLGALTLGGIAGVAVVLGGVVLFQLGVFGTSQPEQDTSEQRAGGQAANGGSTGNSGEDGSIGNESGQPLQNRALSETTEAEALPSDSVLEQPAAVETAEAPAAEAPAADAVELPAEEPAAEAIAETLVADQDTLATSGIETETSQEVSAAEGGEADEAAKETAEEIALAEPAADTADAAPAAPETAEAKEDVFVLEAPELDLVRVDRDGAAVVAGRAQEGVRLSVLLDGEVLEQLDVPAGGEFVSLTTIALSADAQVVSLLAEHDGQQIVSGASFILAPVSPVASVPEENPASQVALAPEEEAVSPAAAVEDSASLAVTALEEEPVETAAAKAADDAVQDQEQIAALDLADSAGAEPPAAAEQKSSVQSRPVSADADEEAAEPVQEDLGTAASEPAAAEPAPAAKPAAPQPQGQAVAVLRADQGGIEVVQPALPADPELRNEVALDSISYNGTGGVELSGRARPQSRVRVYVDNLPVAELDAAGDGRWSGQLGDVAPGIYTLRLDEIEPASGAVMSRLETPFKREAPEVLPQPGDDAAPGQPAPLVRAVTVQKGDTLWAISQEKYGSGFLYVRVFEANRGAIRDPDLIYPGQVFSIPE